MNPNFLPFIIACVPQFMRDAVRLHLEGATEAEILFAVVNGRIPVVGDNLELDEETRGSARITWADYLHLLREHTEWVHQFAVEALLRSGKPLKTLIEETSKGDLESFHAVDCPAPKQVFDIELSEEELITAAHAALRAGNISNTEVLRRKWSGDQKYIRSYHTIRRYQVNP